MLGSQVLSTPGLLFPLPPPRLSLQEVLLILLHAYAALCFPFSGPSSFTGCRALIFFTISPAASSQSWLLLPEGMVLNMQHHASVSFSPSLIMILSIFPVKGHLSRCLRFFINVCEGKSSLIIMKTIAETPPGEGSSRLCRRFNFRDPLIGKIA